MTATPLTANGQRTPGSPKAPAAPKPRNEAALILASCRQRIRELAPTALETLVRLMTDPATSASVRTRCATDLLDRAGLKTAVELVVTATEATNADLDAAIARALEARLPAPSQLAGEASP